MHADICISSLVLPYSFLSFIEEATAYVSTAAVSAPVTIQSQFVSKMHARAILRKIAPHKANTIPD